MNLFKSAFKYIWSNFAEIYTLLVVFVLVPLVIGNMTSPMWGLLLSFVLQGIIGVLYIKGKTGNE